MRGCSGNELEFVDVVGRVYCDMICGCVLIVFASCCVSRLLEVCDCCCTCLNFEMLKQLSGCWRCVGGSCLSVGVFAGFVILCMMLAMCIVSICMM